MDSSDHDGIKRDISVKVTDIFDNFEEENNRLPTMEEFRTIFTNHAEQYIGRWMNSPSKGSKKR